MLTFQKMWGLMDDWLSNPVVQAALVPFVVSMLGTALFMRVAPRWSGLGLILGFGAAMWLILGLELSPLTSTRKIAVLGLLAGVTGVLLDLLQPRRAWTAAVLFAGGAIAIVWVIWPVLSRREGIEMWTLTLGAVAYVGSLSAVSEILRGDSLRAGSAALMLGLASSLAAVLGASAILGQFGGAVAAASGAYLCLAVLRRVPFAGYNLALPAGLVCALIGYSATVYAKLPWYSLPVIATIPFLAAWMPVPFRSPRWFQSIIILAALSPAVVMAVFLAWRGAGPAPL
jgi:hypothetical protein